MNHEKQPTLLQFCYSSLFLAPRVPIIIAKGISTVCLSVTLIDWKNGGVDLHAIWRGGWDVSKDAVSGWGADRLTGRGYFGDGYGAVQCGEFVALLCKNV